MTSTRNNQPWVNTNIKRLAKQKQRAYKQAKQNQKWERYRSLKSELQRSCRQAHDEYVNNLITDAGSSAKKTLWTYVKSKRNDKVGVYPLKKDGQTYSDSKPQADILNDQFSSVFTTEPDNSLPRLGLSPYPTIPDINITVNGIYKLLGGLNPHKATGPDEITTRILKEAAAELSPAVTLLQGVFQASLQQNTPSDWLKANVVPAFKKGDRSKAENYRPISLTSVLCKLLEHIIHSHIMTHFATHNILSDTQHGFRKHRSTETQLIGS